MLIPPGPTKHPMMIRTIPDRIAPRMIDRIPAITKIAARIHKSNAAPELRCAPMSSMVLIPSSMLSTSRSRSSGVANRVGPHGHRGTGEGSRCSDRGRILLEGRGYDHREDDTDQD